MDKIKSLQFKKLLKELDYIESDFEYRSEVISDADSKFINSINEFLLKHPELKDLYDQKITDKINNSIKNGDGSGGKGNEEFTDVVAEFEEESKNQEVIPPKIKKLYREIVKLTHPDKVKKKRLNELYIKATDYYNLIDKIGIYKICNELDIDYDLEYDDENAINDKISELKNRINFLESTFTWKWYNTEDEIERNQIMINYIKLRIM